MLRLVDYDPLDYSLAEVFSGKGGTISGEKEISQVFSLYFQWPEHSQTFLSTQNTPNRPIKSHIFYDTDQKIIDQIYIRVLKDDDLNTQGPFTIRFTIFERCYEFESNPTERFKDNDELILCFPSPKNLKELFRRKAHRIKANQIDESEIQIINIKNEEKIKCHIIQIDMNSIVIDNTNIPIIGKIEINKNQIINYEIIRKDAEFSIIRPIIEHEKEYGIYFSLYSKFTYPGLMLKQEVSNDEVYNLYENTNYFATFKESQEKDFKNIIYKTWDDIRSGLFSTTIDYIFKDKNKNITGSSSLTKSFISSEKEYWFFHQLCSLATKENLEGSDALYNWRCDYNYYKNQSLNNIGTFRGESRWLERIYTNFIMKASKDSLLTNVHCYKLKFKKHNHNLYEVTEFMIGDTTRFQFCTENFLAATGPNNLNANDNLNLIILLNDIPDSEILKIGETLSYYTSGEGERYLSVVSPTEKAELERYGYKQKINRYFCIPSSELLALKESIKHSILVTKKKYENR